MVRGIGKGVTETESNLGLDDQLCWGPRTAFWPESSLSSLRPPPTFPPTTTGGSGLSLCRSIPGNLHGYLRGVSHWDAKVGYVLQVQNTHRQWWGLACTPSPQPGLPKHLLTPGQFLPLSGSLFSLSKEGRCHL